MQSNVVTIKAFLGSPFFEMVAIGPKNGTTPSAAIAWITHKQWNIFLVITDVKFRKE